MEHAVYSILSPEGFASILWKDGSKAKEAAALMRMTAQDLYKAGIVERVVGEERTLPVGDTLTEENMYGVVSILRSGIGQFLEAHADYKEEELLEKRYQRFRKF